MLLLLSHAFFVQAHAHIEVDSPPPRYADQKVGPCGRGPTDARTANVTEFVAGQTITVTWRETINHPSHFRIAFDDDGQDFVDPPAMDAFYSDPTVLLDEIPDEADGTYSVEVTLPQVECDNCTLQVVQVMYDKPPYVPGTNDLYYQCIDLVLVAGELPEGDADTDADADSDTDSDVDIDTAGTGDTGADKAAACGCRTGGGSSLALLGGLALLLARRRGLRP